MLTRLFQTSCTIQARRLFSSQRNFDKIAAQLNAVGMSVGQHVMSVTSQQNESVSKCPFLASHPLLQRTAMRESNARSYARRFPINVVKGLGAKIWDADGNEYLDCLNGAGTLSLGHNHPIVVEAAENFLKSGMPMQLLDLSSPVKDEFVTELEKCLPENMRNAGVRVQFCSPAGTDVTEAAMKLAKMVTKRSGILAFSGAYHGHTLTALSHMGNLGAKENVPGLPSQHFLPYPYAYRCPFGIGADGHKKIAYYIDHLLGDVESGIVKPAAIIIEAIQGEGGVIPAPVEFLQRLREITEKHGILLIIDEIQAGIARSGKMFAFEHANIVPDMVCLSKAVGGGMPMGVLVYGKHLDKWGPGSHAGTFRGNQLGMVTGAAALRFTRDNDIASEAARKGEFMMRFLNDLKAECKYIGDVRGRGMMLGVEIVNADGPCDELGSYAPDGVLATELQVRAFAKGMVMERGGRGGCVMRCKFVFFRRRRWQLQTSVYELIFDTDLCPLITPDEQIYDMLNIFKDALLESITPERLKLIRSFK